GTATGIVKWKSRPQQARLSADNRGDLRQTPAGQNCYRYREMEIWPHRARLSADNEVICTRPPQARTATGIVKWNAGPDWQ
ncbi:hypothetical protein ACEUBQ_20750, partial [Aeromonas veronii]